MRDAAGQPAFEGRRVMVTGGLGFIGSSLARRLVSLGARVLIVDSLVPGHGGNLHNIHDFSGDVEVARTDLRDAAAMAELIGGRELVFNLAGQSSHLDSMREPLTDLDINARAQLSLLEVCRRHNPTAGVVFSSTRQVYGRPERLPVGEEHPVRPVDVNGIDKLAAEQFHLLYGRVHGLRTCVLRLTNTLGPGMRIRDARQTFVGLWIRRVLEGEPFEVWDGSQLRDFTYVDDVVDAFLRAAAEPAMAGGVFNVGGTGPVSLLELARLLVRVNGGGTFDVRPFPDENRRIDIGDYHADDRRLREIAGWRPAVGLEEALRRTLAFYREHGRHYL